MLLSSDQLRGNKQEEINNRIVSTATEQDEAPLKPNYCIAAIYIDTIRIYAVVTEYNCDRSELTLR